MKSRLIRSIDEHLPLEFITEVKVDGNAVDAMVLAAHRSRLDAVSWLLNEGVSIPYGLLDEKLSNDQPLIYQYLSVCSSNSSVPEPALIEGICFRALNQKQSILADRIVDKLSDPKSFVAMAFAKKQSDTAKRLLARSQYLKQESKLEDLTLYTSGYWAALHQIDELGDICKTLQDWVFTLSQLSAEGHEEAFERVYKLGMEKDKKLDSEFFEQDWLPEDKLSHEHNDIYKKASAGHGDILKKANITLENYYTVFLYAYNQKNYVAISSILECCDTQALLKSLFSRNEKNASLFLLIGGHFDLFELLFDWQKEPIIKNYIQIVWGSEENLQRLIDASELAHCKSYTDFVRQKKINYLNHDIQLLSRFASQFDTELEAKNCCSERYNCNRSRKCSLGITSGFLLACIALMTTGSVLGLDSYEGGIKISDGPGEFMFVQGAAFGSLIFVGLLIYVCCVQFGRAGGQVDLCGMDSKLINCGNERFYDLEINQYGQSIRLSAETLFAEFSELKTNPFANKTLANKVSDILPEVQRIVSDKRAMLAALSKPADFKVEIVPIKTAENKSEEEDEPELLIRQVGLFSSKPQLRTPLLGEYKTGFNL